MTTMLSTSDASDQLQEKLARAGTAGTSKTVVVLGAAYAGRRCAQVLSEKLPQDWHLVVIDRNTHFNRTPSMLSLVLDGVRGGYADAQDVYVFPRYTVLPHHAPKAFIPYTCAFEPRTLGDEVPTTKETSNGDTDSHGSTSLPASASAQRTWYHAVITSVAPHSVTFSLLSPTQDSDAGASLTVDFDYAVYCLGASLPGPVDTWTLDTRKSLETDGKALGSKTRGISFMERQSASMSEAQTIAIVGAGALGIQLATDLKTVYPGKTITLIHSRDRVMPLYPMEMHEGVLARLQILGIQIILGERIVQWPTIESPNTLTTASGRTVTADLFLPCTGQKPLTALLESTYPSAILPSKRIKVLPTLQINDGQGGLPNWFAAGDCAETGSIQAGHTAYWQGDMAARNIVRAIAAWESGKPVEFDSYKPTPPAIKVTLGMPHAITSNAQGTVASDDGIEDLNALVIWHSHGVGNLPITA